MLTEEQMKAVVEWRSLHYPACALCACQDYLIDSIVGMPTVGDAGLEEGGMSVVPIACRSCGYTIFVSATVLGFKSYYRPPTKIE